MLDNIAELQWKYQSVDKVQDGLSTLNEEIRCCIGVPSINLMKVPLQVTSTH